MTTPHIMTLVHENPDTATAVVTHLDSNQYAHCLDGPAEVSVSVLGYIHKEWYIHGQLARPAGGPTAVEAHLEGRNKALLSWRKSVDRHRLDGPALVNTNGTAWWHVDSAQRLAHLWGTPPT